MNEQFFYDLIWTFSKYHIHLFIRYIDNQYLIINFVIASLKRDIPWLVNCLTGGFYLKYSITPINWIYLYPIWITKYPDSDDWLVIVWGNFLRKYNIMVQNTVIVLVKMTIKQRGLFLTICTVWYLVLYVL